jgi:hypothetical protein
VQHGIAGTPESVCQQGCLGRLAGSVAALERDEDAPRTARRLVSAVADGRTRPVVGHESALVSEPDTPAVLPEAFATDAFDVALDDLTLDDFAGAVFADVFAAALVLEDALAGAFFAVAAVVGLVAAADFVDVDFEVVDFAAADFEVVDLVAADFEVVDLVVVDFAVADFEVVVLEVRRPAAGFFAGPLARLSASSCTARAKSISSTDSPRGIVAFVSPSVT